MMFLIGVFFSVLTGLCQPFMSYTYGELTQVLVTITKSTNNDTTDPASLEIAYQVFERDMNQVVVYFFLCGFAYFIFMTLQCSIMKFIGDSATYQIRENYISCLLQKDIQYFDVVSTGHFSTVLNENFERLREVLNEKISIIISLLTDFTIGVTLAFYTDWRLASYGILFSLGIAVSGFLCSASMVKCAVQQNKHYSNAGCIACQALESYKTVCSLNGQRQEIEQYSKELKTGQKYGLKKAFIFSISRGLTYFFSNSLNCVIFYFGADMIYEGKLEPAVVIRLFNYLLFGAFCLSEAIPNISRLAAAISTSSSIIEVLSENTFDFDEEYSDSENSRAFEGSIVFQDVQFSYPTRPDAQVLKNVSFEVKPGECIAIVCASGSGKSTIVQLLLRYYYSNSGKISIDGVDLNEIHPKTLHRTIGVVSQEPVLFDTSIKTNIQFGNPKATTQDIVEVLKKANAYSFVCSFPKGIETIVGERGAQLSGGQKQRIAIAHALIANPKILVLDEATSSLDSENERIVQEALENAAIGRTTIIIAHRLSTIRNAERIIVMQKGEIVEVGNHDELIAKNGIFYDLIQSQSLKSKIDKTDSPKLDIHRKSMEELGIPTETESKSASIEEEDSFDDSKKLLNKTTDDPNFLSILIMCSPDYFMLILAVFGSAIQGICYPITAKLIVLVFQSYSMEGEDILIHGHFWALGYLFLALFRPLTLYLQYYFFGKVSEKLSTRLRVKSFIHLLSLPCSFYDEPKNSPTRLSTRLSTDSSNVKAAIDDRLGCVIMTSVAISLALTTSFINCWQMTIQVLMVVPLLYLAKYLYGTATEYSIRDDALAYETSNKVAIESLNNIKTVRALNLENTVMLLINSSLKKIRDSYFKRALIQGLANGFSKSCILFICSICYKFGLYLALNKYVLPMDTYLVFMTLAMTSTMAGQAAAYMPDYKKAVHAAGLITKLLSNSASMHFEKEEGRADINHGEIQSKAIRFHYDQRPDKTILDGINLNVEPGKTIALVGPSGCGKSTFISILERFYRATDGEMKVDNESVENINLHHLRSNLALVSQEPTLFNCSIRDNLLYGLTRKIPEFEIQKALQISNVLNFILQLPQGLETIVGERGTQLSGGQKQRIAIARAILRNPKILLLDEATSALDSESEKLVQNALDTASKRLTTVIVAHRLSTVVNADFIAVLNHGKIVEQGTHKELMELQNIYWNMFLNHAKKT